jgi:hypothetical protein
VANGRGRIFISSCMAGQIVSVGGQIVSSCGFLSRGGVDAAAEVWVGPGEGAGFGLDFRKLFLLFISPCIGSQNVRPASQIVKPLGKIDWLGPRRMRMRIVRVVFTSFPILFVISPCMGVQNVSTRVQTVYGRRKKCQKGSRSGGVGLAGGGWVEGELRKVILVDRVTSGTLAGNAWRSIPG